MQQIELPGLALAEPQALRRFPSASGQRFGIACDPQVDLALAGHAPVYVGVSGGKDSQALAYRVQTHLDHIGHAGPRALIHSDLGRIEWRDSAPVCARLAERLNWELLTVRRPAGDMLDRAVARLDSVFARQPEVRAGAMETSRMPWRWLFSAVGKHFTRPSAPRASCWRRPAPACGACASAAGASSVGGPSASPVTWA